MRRAPARCRPERLDRLCLGARAPPPHHRHLPPSCGTAYRAANERTRTLYNRAVFETLIVRDGHIVEPHYAAPFGLVFGVDEFEQGSLERETRLELATPTLAR